mmetsp:Transcript_19139/g.32904  ORF Transcript_19139/g.32904 Transcript_19139/m.32904 type:complete len:312 (-) Transcript_19139:203-1138(-)
MRVTMILPSYFSSTTAPKMMLQLGSARPVTTSDTRLTSCKVRSFPPEMLNTMPVARSIDLWIRGALVAASAACVARSLPDALPIPNMAVPLLHMMAFTSAKSTLTKPGICTISLMPCTPWPRTLSARAKASCRAVPSPATSRRRSLGITITESTAALNAAMPSVACVERRRPSKLNGWVTTPTVKIPKSFAILATTGAAPVPVPPPMPAVMNTRSAPCTIFVSASCDSWAACCPREGFPPQPSPRVSSEPICTLLAAEWLASACASVLTAQNSTPCSPVAIIRLRALLPPPPTPITLIRASPPTGVYSPEL